MNAQTRIYLIGRIQVLVSEIDEAHREIDLLNKLLREDIRQVAFNRDVDHPVPAHGSILKRSPPVAEPTRLTAPPVPPLSRSRPVLTSTKSAGNLRERRAATPSESHPAHRPAVASQSRFPLFRRSSRV